MDLFSKHIGIDLGTANTLVYLKGKGIIVNEPSVVAINTKTNTVLAVGDSAKEMIGRTPGHIMAIRPLKDGVIADFEVTQEMLKYFIGKAMRKAGARKPKVIICTPSGVTQVEKRALEKATLQAGAKEVYLIEEPMAAAIGAGMPINEPIGNMVVDIGGGTCETAVISLGGIVTGRSINIAGDELDKTIVNYTKKRYNLIIGDRTAEEIKLKIGSIFPGLVSEKMDIRGRDWINGLPTTITISSEEICECLKEPCDEIIETIKVTLDKTPPELSSDIMAHGIMLTGGGSLLRGLDKLVERETGIRTFVADNPLNCVAIGAGKVLDDIGVLSKVLISSKK
jgi:rod shape-determining protein MreB